MYLSKKFFVFFVKLILYPSEFLLDFVFVSKPLFVKIRLFLDKYLKLVFEDLISGYATVNSKHEFLCLCEVIYLCIRKSLHLFPDIRFTLFNAHLHIINECSNILVLKDNQFQGD